MFLTAEGLQKSFEGKMKPDRLKEYKFFDDIIRDKIKTNLPKFIPQVIQNDVQKQVKNIPEEDFDAGEFPTAPPTGPEDDLTF